MTLDAQVAAPVDASGAATVAAPVDAPVDAPVATTVAARVDAFAGNEQPVGIIVGHPEDSAERPVPFDAQVAAPTQYRMAFMNSMRLSSTFCNNTASTDFSLHSRWKNKKKTKAKVAKL